MRNREATRYARWAAIAAGAIVLVVSGVYAERALRRARARRSLPVTISVSVQQQSAQFSFEKAEQNRTLFKVRASRATQYKDQNRTLLEDVWITLYGRDGSRNDDIHTRECSYEPDTGFVRCQGEVTIAIEGARRAAGPSAEPSLEVKTSDLVFHRDTGEASTPAPVEFRFSQGQGHGVGLTYSTRDSMVRLDHAVALDVAASEKTGGLPVSASGSSLEMRRSEHKIVLAGPATVRLGGRELTSERVVVELDADYHARRAWAEGHPQIRTNESGGRTTVSATRFDAVVNPAGWVERIHAGENVKAERETAGGADRFSAAHAEFVMAAGQNLVKEMTATGGVSLESQRGSDSRLLKTEVLHATFSTGEPPASSTERGAPMTNRQRIESLETLAPATLESKTATDTTAVRARRLVAHLDSDGRLDQLLGHGDAEVRRRIGGGAPQVIFASEMAATFGANGQWETLDESGNVRFEQADRQATAARAKIVRATDAITLEGSPVLSDSMSRTTCGHAVINQKSGELTATGGVVSTYLSTGPSETLTLGAGAAHISADAVSGSLSSGHLVYSGHARLWQGEAVLDAEQIELWRDEKKLQASGHVVAVFPQTAGAFPPAPQKGPTPTAAVPSGPVLWRINAPSLSYWSNEGRAHLEGGVTASSAQGSLQSRALDVFLAPATSAPVPPAGSGVPAPAPAGRQLSRVLARGNVMVQQAGRQGSAEQADYTAADGKFVLSGGQPTLADTSGNTTTGHSLTLFVASDTILIDSREGSRTLTRHRIEK